MSKKFFCTFYKNSSFKIEKNYFEPIETTKDYDFYDVINVLKESILSSKETICEKILSDPDGKNYFYLLFQGEESKLFSRIIKCEKLLSENKSMKNYLSYVKNCNMWFEIIEQKKPKEKKKLFYELVKKVLIQSIKK